jgi:hypothetical protein
MKRSNVIDSDGIVQGIYTLCLEPFLKLSKNALAISYPTLCPSVEFFASRLAEFVVQAQQQS